MTLLDGAMGTLLQAHGIDTPPPLWATAAVRTHPERVARIHHDYANAGATVHTAMTFRASPTAAGAEAADLARAAIRLTRGAVPAHHRVAGSLAPVHDCWQPDLSPADALALHRDTAAILTDAGADLLLVETFAHPAEAAAAVQAAVETGLEVWAALTPGWDGSLLPPSSVADLARLLHGLGAGVVCLNCLPADPRSPWVRALAGAGVPWGVYPNGGDPAMQASAWAGLAAAWRDEGALVVGGCCGTTPAHIAAAAVRLGISTEGSKMT